VASNRESTSLADVIHLPIVDIYGLAFTPSCSPCPAGTYSESSGAKICRECAVNHRSQRRSPKCEPCPVGEYSMVRAERCEPRPKCDVERDYYPIRDGKCAKSGAGWEREVRRGRTRPQVCVERDGEGTQKVSTEACAACNAGYRRSQMTGECEACPEGEFSLDGAMCQHCPNNTRPDYGVSAWRLALGGLGDRKRPAKLLLLFLKMDFLKFLQQILEIAVRSLCTLIHTPNSHTLS